LASLRLGARRKGTDNLAVILPPRHRIVLRPMRLRHPVATGFMPGGKVEGSKGEKSRGEGRGAKSDQSDLPAVALAKEGRNPTDQSVRSV
jgi:hypothetical protein